MMRNAKILTCKIDRKKERTMVCYRCMLVSTLLTGLGVGTSSASTEWYITECRNDSIDQQGFRQCISLQYDAAEATLENIEETWRAELLDVPNDEILARDGAVPSSVAITEAGKDSPTGVIAIVSDATVAETGNANIINVDTNADRPEPSTGQYDIGVVGSSEQHEHLAAITGTFRQFRDEQCLWDTSLIENEVATIYLEACKTALTVQHARKLRMQLSEKRVTDGIGRAFRGFYLQTANGASFQDCDRRQDWWVTADSKTLAAMQARYDDITAKTLEMVYAEVRGRRGPAPGEGPGAKYVASLDVQSVNLLRPILERDCTAASAVTELESGEIHRSRSSTPESEALAKSDRQKPDSPDDFAEEIDNKSLTVDDFGESGFLYGYFQSWMSVCAVEQPRVCKTQTQAQFSGEGDWLLVVDRSQNNDWRVRLQNAIHEGAIVGDMRMGIDGNEIFTRKVSATGAQLDSGVTVATAGRARDLIVQMRRGGAATLSWSRSDGSTTILRFTLLGISRALNYFDSAGK